MMYPSKKPLSKLQQDVHEIYVRKRRSEEQESGVHLLSTSAFTRVAIQNSRLAKSDLLNTETSQFSLRFTQRYSQRCNYSRSNPWMPFLMNILSIE